VPFTKSTMSMFLGTVAADDHIESCPSDDERFLLALSEPVLPGAGRGQVDGGAGAGRDGAAVEGQRRTRDVIEIEAVVARAHRVVEDERLLPLPLEKSTTASLAPVSRVKVGVPVTATTWLKVMVNGVTSPVP